MYRLFTILLTTLVLLHAAFGCCIHHAHSGEYNDEDTKATARNCPCSSHRHDADQDNRTPEKPHDKPQVCEEGKCTFARIESSPDDTVAVGDQFNLLCLPGCCVVVPTSEVSNTSASPLSGVAAWPPHLYLALRALLL
ncbi:MAG: hypothetical protein VB835_20585 [Pirellulales bacterium]